MGLRPGERISEFEVVRELAITGHSEVYEARVGPGKPSVVLKLLPAGRPKEQHRRIEQEADILESLSGPYTVQLRRHTRLEDGTSFIVMEHLPGPSLAELLTSPERTEDDLWRWTFELLDAVAWVHDHHVVHRDLKPDNVLRDRTGRLRLIDFDAALRATPGAVDRLTTIGGFAPRTRAYKPPGDPEEADERYDLFSVGVMLAELWLREHPWWGKSPSLTLRNQLIGDPTLWWPALRGLPRPLIDVITRATAPHPDHRHQTAAELREELEQCRTALMPQPESEPQPEPQPSPGPYSPVPPANQGRPLTTLVMLSATVAGALGMLTWRNLPTAAAPSAQIEPAPAPAWETLDNPFISVPLPPNPVLLGGPARGEPWEDPPSRAFEPAASVHSPAAPYQLQQHEVTWSELGPWCEANPRERGCDTRRARAAVAAGWAHQPVTGVPRPTAQGYCASLGGDLPTEEQWEWAARGQPDGALRPHPWGPEPVDPGRTRALGWLGGEEALADVMSSPQDVTPDTALYDLAGNALEWTAGPFRNAAGPNAGGSTTQAPLIVETEREPREPLQPAPVRGLPWSKALMNAQELAALGTAPSTVWRHLRWDGAQPEGVVMTESPLTRLDGVGFRCARELPRRPPTRIPNQKNL